MTVCVDPPVLRVVRVLCRCCGAVLSADGDPERSTLLCVTCLECQRTQRSETLPAR